MESLNLQAGKSDNDDDNDNCACSLQAPTWQDMTPNYSIDTWGADLASSAHLPQLTSISRGHSMTSLGAALRSQIWAMKYQGQGCS